MATTRMSVQDALWLTMDRPNNLMVVDTVIVLRGVPDLDVVRAELLAGIERFPVLKRKPRRRGTTWTWVDDASFTIDHHVTSASLDAPADLAALQRFAAGLRSAQLSKSRPLWSVHLVGPITLDDGTVGSAIVARFHHAIADGVRLTQLMLAMCDTGPDTSVPKVARDGAGGGPVASLRTVADATSEAARVSRSTVRAAFDGLTDLASAVAAARPGSALTAARGLPMSALRSATDGIGAIRHPDRLIDALETLGISDHRSMNDLTSVTKLLLTDSGSTVWTGRPGRRKEVAWSPPIPLADVKRVARAQGATVNDVLLSAMAGALRAYLARHGQAVDEVVWMVPVNLKPFEENLPEDLGNYFALVMLPMALHHGDRAERLRETHRRMDRIKHSDEAVLTFTLQRVLSMSPSGMAAFLTDFFANKAVGVLTNVPGPTGEMSFAGIPVAQVIGFAPCSGDQPMTATIFSYNGMVTVGFASDAGLLPDPQALVGLVVAEVDAMARDLVSPKDTGKPPQ